jgi:hypothetical protein
MPAATFSARLSVEFMQFKPCESREGREEGEGNPGADGFNRRIPSQPSRSSRDLFSF